MDSKDTIYEIDYPFILSEELQSKEVAGIDFGDLFGSDYFSFDLDITALSPGESGTVFGLGSSLVTSVDKFGELVIQASSDAGPVEVRTSGADLANAEPHKIDIDYSDNTLEISIDGEKLGASRMSALSQNGSETPVVQFGATGAEIFGSKIGSFLVAVEDHAREPDIDSKIGDTADSDPEIKEAESANDKTSDEETAKEISEAPFDGVVVTVANSDELYDALSEIDGKTTILLEGGDYGELVLKHSTGFDYGYSQNVTIASANESNPATFTGFTIRNASNLTFQDITFDYTFKENDPLSIRPFTIRSSENIAFEGSRFDGDLAQGISSVYDDHGWATGLAIHDSSGVRVEDTEFFQFWKGALFSNIDSLSIVDNDLHSMRMDGLNFSAVQDVRIQDNHIHNFSAATGSSDHKDMIQFWSRETDRPSTDVVISGNKLDIGSGDETQSIFIRNEVVDHNQAGREMYYRNFSIEDNIIVNGHRHGITVGQTLGLDIVGNSVLHADGGNPDGADHSVEIPWINVSAASREVNIQDNLVADMSIKSGADWKVSNNIFVQDQNSRAPGYYSDVFLSSSLELKGNSHSFIARPDGLIQKSGAGATETLAPSDGLRPGFLVSSVEEDSSVRIFDATGTFFDGGLVGSEGNFDWKFSNGTTAKGQTIAAVFAEQTYGNVELTVTLPNGDTETVSQAFEISGPDVIRFGPQGNLLLDGTDTLALPGLGGSGVSLGRSGASIEIPREHIVDILGADEFLLSFTVDGTSSSTSGNIFRIGSALKSSVKLDGDLAIRATTDDGNVRLETSGKDINDGKAHDIELRLADEILTISIDGEVSARGSMSPIADNSIHGLSIGNPWGRNFESVISDFDLSVNNSDFNGSQLTNVAEMYGFDPLIMG